MINKVSRGKDSNSGSGSTRNGWIISTLFLWVLILGSCIPQSKSPTGGPFATASATSSPIPMPTLENTREVVVGQQPRIDYPTPRIAPVTPIPAPVTALKIPEEVRLLVLLGSGKEAPFVSRTEAVMLAFYHPRLDRKSVV